MHELLPMPRWQWYGCTCVQTTNVQRQWWLTFVYRVLAMCSPCAGFTFADHEFAEAAVDDMRLQKNDVLERYRKQAERRARQLAEKHKQQQSGAFH